MTSAERRHLMRLLVTAQRGDSEDRPRAREELAEQISRHFHYMVRSYASSDPAIDQDDLYAQFQLGIWLAIDKADERGDPLYHLAWRGQKAVCSMLAAIKQRRHGTKQWVEDFGSERSIGTLPASWDLPDERAETDPTFVAVAHEDRQEARRQIAYILGRVKLTDRQKQVVGWMLADPDPSADGANLRLAQTLEVTPQAASHLRTKVVELLSGQSKEYRAFQCMVCGRQFKSPGALTQHKKAQSGHKPCKAKATA